MPHSPASVRSIHHHLVHVANRCLIPQVAFDRKRTKADRLLVTHGTKIYLLVRSQRSVIDAPKGHQIDYLAWPELTQEDYDAVKVLGTALSYLNHGGDERAHAA